MIGEEAPEPAGILASGRTAVLERPDARRRVASAELKWPEQAPHPQPPQRVRGWQYHRRVCRSEDRKRIGWPRRPTHAPCILGLNHLYHEVRALGCPLPLGVDDLIDERVGEVKRVAQRDHARRVFQRLAM